MWFSPRAGSSTSRRCRSSKARAAIAAGLALLFDERPSEIEPAGSVVVPNPLPVQAPGPEVAVSPARLRAVPLEPEAGPSRPAVAAAPVVAARAVTPVRTRGQARRWTDEDRARVAQLADEGMTHAEIERVTGVPRTNIRRWTAQTQEATA